MKSGWIKLHRKVIECGFFNNPSLSHFWIWCLLKASHDEYEQLVGYTPVNIKPGQFIFGRKTSTIETGLSSRTTRTCLQTLVEIGNLTIQPTNKFTIVTICKWETYQNTKSTNDHPNDQQTTNKRPTNDHKQECKELKNNKDTPKGVVRTAPTPQAELVDNFSKVYQKATGHSYSAKNTHYILLAQMIGKHGVDVCKHKLAVLATMCADGSRWPAKNGWADFTIENLVRNWNSIIYQEKLTEQEIKNKEFLELREKGRLKREKQDSTLTGIGVS